MGAMCRFKHEQQRQTQEVPEVERGERIKRVGAFTLTLGGSGKNERGRNLKNESIIHDAAVNAAAAVGPKKRFVISKPFRLIFV